MGYADRMAMKREQKRLAPFFRADEHFIQTDVMDSATVKWHEDGSRTKIGTLAFSLTNRAIYVRAIKGLSSDLVRIPYVHVVNVLTDREMLEVITNNASWLFHWHGQPMGADNYTLIGQELTRLENFRADLDVPGGKARVRNRPIDENGNNGWIVNATQGVDLDSEEVLASLNSQLPEAIAKHGPIT